MRINEIRKWALDAGFDEIGFCRPDDFPKAERIVGEQPPLNERRQLRFHPCEDEPQTKSLAVLLWVYDEEPLPEKGDLFVDSYYRASNEAYHAAKTLEARLLEAGLFAKANVSYPAREAAIRAGLGIIGRNGMLITPEHGSRVVIILMATDVEPETVSDCVEPSGCLACGRCTKACPAKALDQHGLSHPERCLRNFMMEGIVVPDHLRETMGQRLLGCDMCQRVCPMQKRRAMLPSVRWSLDAFMTLDDAAFSNSVARLAQVIGRNAARPQRVRAQAALLAGNRKHPADLPVLRNWALSPFDAVREHAVWAVARIEADVEKSRNRQSDDRT